MPIGTYASAVYIPASGGVILTEPCDDYTTNGWVISGGAPSIVAGRVGNAFSIPNSVATTIDYNIPSGSQSASMTVNFWLYLATGSVGPSLLKVFALRSDSGATEHMRLLFDNNIYMQIMQGNGTSMDLVGPAAAMNTWFNVEFSVVLNDTTGSYIFKVGGVTKSTLTNVDTKNAGTKTVFDQIRFYDTGGPGISAAYLIDDITLSSP